MRRILLRAHKSPFQVASAEETLRRNLIGNNVGNLLFSESTYRLLDTHDTEIVTSNLRKLRPGWVNDNFDGVVIPLANAFRRSFIDALNEITDLMDGLTIPVVILGVGSQANFDNVHSHNDGDNDAVRRFVATALKRGPSIGVRGELTAEYLADLGFGAEHVDVIGCPSMFFHGPDLAVTPKVDTLHDQSKIAFNVSPYRKTIGVVSLQVAKRHPNLTYIAQDHHTLNLLLNGVYDGKERPADVANPVVLNHPLIASNRVRFCLDPTTWLAELSGYDFSIGTRIHGNIAALVAGTPALVVAHDGRTRELVEYHQIPSVSLRSVKDGLDIPKQYAAADWAPMMSGHAALWEHFTAFLATHGLRTTFATGEDRRRFDQQIAATQFPAPVQTLMGSPHEVYEMKRQLERRRRPMHRRIDALRRRRA